MSPSEDAKAQRYLHGEMSAEEQRAFEGEILENPRLANLIYEEANLDAAFEDAKQARDTRRTEAITRGRKAWLPLLLAAAAVVAVVMLWDDGPSPEEAPPLLRGNDTQFEAVSPRGDVTEPSIRFEWTADERAVSYRLEVMDETGRLVFEAESADTQLTVPVASLGDAFRRGSWRVVPRDDLDLERPATTAVDFRIVAP